MKQKIKLTAIALTSSAILTGCASNADIQQMVSANQPAVKIKNQHLVKNIAVDNVTGGNETNPLWTSQINNANFKEALIKSLKNANLYHEINGEKYKLNANLVKLSQPLLGLNLTVSCQVHYSIMNVKLNKQVFDKDITTSYTAKISDSLYAPARLKIANEGAARENIQEFIKAVYQTSIV
jgi:hypothetical protein